MAFYILSCPKNMRTALIGQLTKSLVALKISASLLRMAFRVVRASQKEIFFI